MSLPRKLTDLELTALGNVWKKSSCTAYEVMQEFAGSASAHYRAGAGSIYPLMARLQQGGYLRSQVARRGRKQVRQVYSITAKGRAALRAWVSLPVPEADAMVPSDPLRTRVYFLEILPPAKRREFLDGAYATLRLQLRRTQHILQKYREEKNRFGALAIEGAVRVMRARLSWIDKIRRELGG